MLRVFLRTLAALAKFAFVDGKNYVRYPDNSIRRVAERASVRAKRERKINAKANQKKKARTDGRHAE
jgi:hypothetical protein